MAIFLPSVYPSLSSPCRKTSMRAFETAREVGSRNPIRGTFPAGWASAKRSETRVKTTSSQTVFLCMALPPPPGVAQWICHNPKLNETRYFAGTEQAVRVVNRLGGVSDLIRVRQFPNG